MIDNLILVILAILATFRIARLLHQDTILDGLREPIFRRASEKGSFCWWLSEWLNCPHCIGVWVSLIIVVLMSPFTHWGFFMIILGWLAVAGGQSWLQSIVDRDGEDEEDTKQVE